MSKHEAEAHHKKPHAEVKHQGDQSEKHADGEPKHKLASEAAKELSSAGGNKAADLHSKHKQAGAGKHEQDLTIVGTEGGKAAAGKQVAAAEKGGDGKVAEAKASSADKSAPRAGKAEAKPAWADKVEAKPEGTNQARRGGAELAAGKDGNAAESKPLVIADKTAQFSDSFKTEAAEANAKAGADGQKPPKITVSLQEFGDDKDLKEPHYVVKKDGTVEMHGDPVKMGSKEVRVEVERDPGAVNPSDQQLAVTDQLVAKINQDLQKAYPQQADQVVLDDQGDLVSSKAEKAAGLKSPPDKEGLSPETKESVEQTKRLHRSGGVDMPRAATDGMGSFETRTVPRQQGETDKVAAMKESWAGLFKPDKDHPYETVRRHPDGEMRVGRYGFNAKQLENWLSGLTPEQIDKLIAEGKLPKNFADPKFREQFMNFLQKMKNGEQPTPDEMKQFLPKEAQETIAGQILEKMSGAVGDNPGMAAAAAVSGRDAGTIDENFINSPQAKELSQAGKTLYDIATNRQAVEGNVVGRLPEGDRRELIVKALEIANKPVTDANIAAVNLIVQHESSWNPNVQNDWDSNARKGIPSQGLMQTIPPTFNSHKDRTGQVEAAGHSNSIRDPLANLVAGINYSYSRYGSLANVPGVKSIARGGDYRPY